MNEEKGRHLWMESLFRELEDRFDLAHREFGNDLTTAIRQIDSMRETFGDDPAVRLIRRTLTDFENRFQGWLKEEDLDRQRLRRLFLKALEKSDSALEMVHDSLDRLLGPNLMLQDQLDPEVILGNLLGAAVEITEADRGFFLLYRKGSQTAKVVASRHFDNNDLRSDEHQYSGTVARQALGQGESVVVSDAIADPIYGKKKSVRALELRSVVAVPFQHATSEPAGVLYLDNHQRPGAFGGREVLCAELIAAAAGLVVKSQGLDTLSTATFESFRSPADPSLSRIITRSPAMSTLLEDVQRAAPSPAPVLVLGESGTGKELIAEALHAASSRSPRHPLVAINCAAIPADLFESQLFGHRKGAFTGAVDDQEGLIAAAEGGTLFLDEIAELETVLQAKLLRFLESKTYRPVGCLETRKADIRVVAATSRNLETWIEEGRFLDALFYRLNVVRIELPPLRKRREDISLLCRHFLELHSSEYGRNLEIDPGAMTWLQYYEYPGNIRELENFMLRLLSTAPRERVRIGDLPREVIQTLDSPPPSSPLADPHSADEILDLPLQDLDDLVRRRRRAQKKLDFLELEHVERVVGDCGGNKSKAAKTLQMGRDKLYEILGRRKDSERDQAHSSVGS